ncbi:MAG: nucleotidyltransferase family protein [Spirochaetes bacterium]|nr:nucleotidyltransferase family protein [Spirochaetota bacterium]
MDEKQPCTHEGKRPHLSDTFLASLCRRWKIRELSLFGSILRGDFRPDSDVDVLVEFEEGAGWSLFDLMDLADELKNEVGRDVHLVEKDGLRNPYRRLEILQQREVLYVA